MLGCEEKVCNHYTVWTGYIRQSTGNLENLLVLNETRVSAGLVGQCRYIIPDFGFSH